MPARNALTPSPRRKAPRQMVGWLSLGLVLAAGTFVAANPPVRLLYGTRRLNVDVPRQSAPSAAPDEFEDPAEPVPALRPETNSNAADEGGFGDSGVEIEIDADRRLPMGSWQPAAPLEDPLSSELEGFQEDDDPQPEMAPVHNRPQARPVAAIADTSRDVTAGADERADARAGGTAQATPAREFDETRLPEGRGPALGAAGATGLYEPWVLTGIAQALGTLVGVLVGVALAGGVVWSLLRRYGGRLEPVVRVELVGAWPAGPPAPAAGESQTAGEAASEPRIAGVEFGDAGIPLALGGPTWDEKRQAALREQERMEAAVLEEIYEENRKLQAQLSAPPQPSIPHLHRHVSPLSMESES